MPSYSDLDRFLQAVFPDYAQRAIFGTDDGNGFWRPFRGTKGLDPELGCYVSLATYPDDASTANTFANAIGSRLLVIDDVGTTDPAKQQNPDAVRFALGRPRARVLTSPGNEQWWYVLDGLVDKPSWHGFVGGVETQLGKALDDGGRIQQWFRVPVGRNLKPGRGGFEIKLLEVDMLAPALEVASIPSVLRARASKQGKASIPLTTQAWGELLALIPNPVAGPGVAGVIDRPEWANIGQRSKARLEDPDDPDAEDIFVAWTAKAGWTDEATIREKWKSFSGTDTEGFLLDAAAEAADPEAYALWTTGVTRPGAASAFDDGLVIPDPSAAPPRKAPGPLTATPFVLGDPTKIPMRDWLYGRLLIRKFISMTVAPGGVGKSALVTSEALAQVTGRNLLGDKPSGELTVWLWNLEDPGEETARRIHAAALHYGVTETDLGGRLFVDSGRDQRLVVAEMDRGKPMIVRPVVGALVREIRARKVDVVVIDPFVSCHELPENDNTAQDMVVKEWGRVAEEGNCAVHLVDHTRKAPAGTEVETESARGAKAKTDAARVVRVINRMTDKQGKDVFGVTEPWRYFNTFPDKSNMAPPAVDRDWFHLESVNLGNGTTAAGAFAGGSVGASVAPGDSVGVAVRWVPPSPASIVTMDNFRKVAAEMAGRQWRTSERSDDWIGIAIGKALDFDPKSKSGKERTAALVKSWTAAGVAQIVPGLDKHRKEKDFIVLKEIGSDEH